MADYTVANTIVNQMGGQARLKVMTGAKNFTAGSNRVAFTIGKGAKDKINHIRVTLNDSDLYDVEFSRVWGTKTATVSKQTGVFFDQLMDVFEEATGFFLTMRARS